MTKTPKNYKNSKIYKISNLINNYIYINGTTNSLNKRFNHYKSMCNQLKKNKALPENLELLYKYMIDSQDYNKFKIELLEEFECNNENELQERINFYKNNKNLNNTDTNLNINNDNIIKHNIINDISNLLKNLKLLYNID